MTSTLVIGKHPSKLSRNIAAIGLLFLTWGCRDAFAGQTLLNFETVVSNDQTIGNPYGDLGIGFLANAWANPEDPVSVKNPPSPPNYLLLYPGSPITCNVSNGFSAISLYYVNGHSTSGQLRTYSGLNGSGSLLASVSLPQTPITGGTTLQTWVQRSLSHSTARSFQISGVAQYVGVDNILLTGPFPPRIIESFPSVTSVMASSATFQSTVNPNGAATSVYFEFANDPDFLFPTTTTPQNIGSGTANVAVTQSATGLNRGTFYYFRVVASNATATVTSQANWFTTLETTVQTLSAADITFDSALLKGAANPQELSTDVYFQFGTNVSLTGATNTPLQNIGSGTANIVFAAPIQNLKPGIYYYRAITTNSAGTQFGTVAGVSINCGYTATDNTAGTFTNISATGTQVIGGGGIDDGVSASVNIGFPFAFFGSEKTNLYLSANGLLTFGGSSTSGGNVDWSRSTSPSLDAIAVLWDDWETAGGVFVQTFGAPGQRVFVAQWNLRPYLGSGLVTFQVQLFEATSDILMYYSDANTDAEHTAGRTASIGIRKNGAPGNGSYLMWSYNFETVYGGSMVRFSPQKPIVTNLVADNFTASEALLHAEVNPNFSPTTVFFEYGTTTSYGSASPALALPGTNALFQPLSAVASNLVAPATYHFRVVASNSLGVVRSPDASFQFGAPYILEQPEDVAIEPWGSASLTVVAAGVPPLNHRWLFNSAEIIGATNATLAFTNAQPSQSGNYLVVVSNSYGSVTSQVARLTIAPPLISRYQWEQRYTRAVTGSDEPQAVVIAPNGNIIVTGNSQASNGSNDFLTVCYNANGLPLWTNRYNGPGNGDDEAASVATDASGKVFVTGFSWGGANADFATIAYSSTGTPLWTNRYNGTANSYDYASEVAVDSAGNVYVGGTSSGGNGDMLVIKYSNAGATLWTTRWNGGSTDFGYAMTADSSGNSYITGRSYNGANYDFATLKLSSAGAILWTNRYNGTGNDDDSALDVKISGTGNIVITGSSYGSSGTTDFATIAYSSAGSRLWTNRYNGPGNGNDDAWSVASDQVGNVYVTGPSPGTGGNKDYATIAYSGTGTPLWTNRYDGGGSDTAVAVRVNTNGQVFATGYTTRTGGMYDYTTIAYATNGALLNMTHYDGPASGHDEPLTRQSLAVAADGIVVTGKSDSGAGNYDYATIKYAVGFPPSFVTQPVSQTNLYGGTANFTAAVSGTEPLFFQWRKDGTNLVNGGPIYGVNSNTLALPNIQFADGGNYDVVVTNLFGSATSTVAILTVVVSPPAITQHPVSRTNVVGTPATFEVTAIGTAPLSYQWRKDGEDLNTETNAVLNLAEVLMEDTGDYDVVVTNNYGSATSAVATLSLATGLGSTPTNAAWSAKILLQLRPSTSSGLYWLDPDGAGTNPPFLAYCDMSTGGGGWVLALNSVAGSEAATTEITNNVGVPGLMSAHTRSVRNLALHAHLRHEIIQQTRQFHGLYVGNYYSNMAGGGDWFILPGHTDSSFLWDSFGQPFVNSSFGVRWYWNGGNTATPVNLNDTINGPKNEAQAAVDRYSIWVRELNLPPIVTSQPTSSTNLAGSAASFSVTTVAAGGYQWRKDGANLNNETNATLAIANVAAGNEGNYDVVITSSYGSATSTVATLTVWYPPVIHSQPSSQTNLVGSTVELTIAAAGISTPINFQWRRNGTNFFNDGMYYIGSLAPQANTLTLTNVQFADAGEYDVVVTNLHGSVTSAIATLTVTIPDILDTSFNLGTDSFIRCSAMQSDERIVLGGFFTSVGAMPRNRIARLDTNGTVDVGFDPNANSIVLCTAVQSDGRIVLGGQFTSLGGTPRVFLARINGDGTLDSGFSANANGIVLALAMQPDGKILVGGSFTNLAGMPRNRIARLNPDGTLDNAFNPNLNGMLYSMAVQSDGKIVIGGEFSTVGATTQSRIARLNGDGTLDTGFAPSVVGGSIYTLVLQSDEKVLVGGSFINVGGIPRNGLARLNPEGALDAGFDPNPTNGVFAVSIASMALQADGGIVIAGNFSSVDGTARTNVARLNPDGTIDPNFIANANSSVASTMLQPDGKLLIGGNFTSIGGLARNYLVRLSNAAAPRTLNVSEFSRVEWLRGGSTPEATHVSFELSTNGSTWTTLGNAARINGGWELTGLNLPTDGIVRARARVSSGQFNGSSGLIEQQVSFAGLPIPEIAVEQPPGNNLVAGVAVVDFGSVLLGGSNSLAFTVKNSGTANLTGLGITLTGAGANHFSITANPTAPVAGPNGSTIFTVAFAPTSDGMKTAVLQMSSNDPDENPFTINLTGVGSLPPMISAQPVSLTNVVDTIASFAVTASGDLPLAYQWRKNGDNLTNVGNVSGAGAATLSLAGVTFGDAGLYDVVITNTYGSVTSAPALLTVVQLPAITGEPVSRTNLAGEIALFSVTASGTGPLTYQWRKGGVNLTSAGNIIGVTTANLSVSNLVAADAGAYDVLVANPYGSVTSGVAVLTVRQVVLISNIAVTATSELGQLGRFASNTVNGVKADSAFWESGGLGWGRDDRAPAITFDLSALYRLDRFLIWNGHESPVGIKRMRVEFGLDGTNFQSFAELQLSPGTGTEVASDTNSLIPIETRFIRFVILQNQDGQQFPYAGANTNNPFVAIDEVEFYGEFLAPYAPRITQQPQSVGEQLPGSSAAFGVKADGTPPLSFQWRKDGANLSNGANVSGATGPTLLLNNLLPADSGNYDIVIASPHGAVTSVVAVLVVPDVVRISNILATATSELASFGRYASNAVNGIKVDGSFWESAGPNFGQDRDPAITFDLRTNYILDRFLIWNSHEFDPGIKRMNVLYSLNGIDFETLSEMQLTPGTATQTPSGNHSLAGIVARYVRFDVLENQHGQQFPYVGAPTNNPLVAIDEVEFYGQPAPPFPLIYTQPISRTNYVGTTAIFSPVVSGPEVFFQWRKDGIPLPNGGRMSGATNSMLTLLNVQTSDVGGYDLVASNHFGMVTSRVATLVIQYFDVTGLLLYLPVNGNAEDTSGNGRNGVVSGATLTTNRFGEAASAYGFNGSSLITVTNLDPDDYSTGFSFGWWFKPFGGGGSPCYWLADGGWGSTYFILPYYFRLGSGSPSTSYALGGLSLPAGQWNHLFVTHDADWNRLYLNGALVFEGAALPLQGNVSTLEMGRDGFVGVVDDFVVFGRGLSSNEVSLLYDGASLVSPPVPPLTPTVFGSPVVSPTEVLLPMTGAAGTIWNLERALALTGPWTNVGSTLIGHGGLSFFQDTNPPPIRSFYRAVKP